MSATTDPNPLTRRVRPALLGVIAALALLVPAYAQASQVSLTIKNELRVGGFGGEKNDIRIKYRAAGVSYAGAGGGFAVTDKTGAVPAGEGCVRLTGDTVGCDATGVTRISVALGDGDDTLIIKTGRNGGVPKTFPVTVHGGSGEDVIRGGSADDRLLGEGGRDVLAGLKGDDLLNGGGGIDGLLGFAGDDKLLGGNGADVLFGQKGRDVLLGQAGADILLARDGQRDRRINCGPGAASKERAIRDRNDPRAVSC